jgi:hypothetical protein
MPHDQWARANARAKYGPVKTDRSKSRRKRSRLHLQHTIERSRFQSPGTVLWFGKYKGKSLRYVRANDPMYLAWLSAITPKSKKLSYLVAYLRNSPNLANRRMARHTGGDEAPATTNMACENRKIAPNSSRTATSDAVGKTEYFATPLHVLARDVE